MKPIKLGRKYAGCAPCSADVKPGSDICFPSVYLNSKQIDGLPRAGTITFRYELARETKDFKNETSDTVLDLLQIVDFKTSEEGKKKLSAEETLDKLRDEVVGEADDEEQTSDDREQYVESDD